ncbi:MAG: type II toxin-antitoxin system RelE/ParE family toxin [Candidatus Sulfotelmatobacter sp.]
MLPLNWVEILEYLEPDGRSPYAEWFDSLNPPAAAKVAVALARMSQGNLSNVKSIGCGVHEYRVDFGPGYRIYLGKDGERMILLLGGGTKKRQQRDIENALSRWQDYKRRKKQEAR